MIRVQHGVRRRRQGMGTYHVTPFSTDSTPTAVGTGTVTLYNVYVHVVYTPTSRIS